MMLLERLRLLGVYYKRINKVFKTQIREEYDKFREQFLKRTRKKEFLSIEDARKNKFSIDWETSEIIEPKQLR